MMPKSSQGLRPGSKSTKKGGGDNRCSLVRLLSPRCGCAQQRKLCAIAAAAFFVMKNLLSADDGNSIVQTVKAVGHLVASTLSTQGSAAKTLDQLGVDWPRDRIADGGAQTLRVKRLGIKHR
jgi:hypothetical protein